MSAQAKQRLCTFVNLCTLLEFIRIGKCCCTPPSPFKKTHRPLYGKQSLRFMKVQCLEKWSFYYVQTATHANLISNNITFS